MSQAYAIVLLHRDLVKEEPKVAMESAEVAAFATFQKLGREHGTPNVVVDPEPTELTVGEMKRFYPYIEPKKITGFKYLAELS